MSASFVASIFATGMTLGVTVTSQLAVRAPSVVVTIMTATPASTPVTVPSWSTVATSGAELLQLTLLSVASSGSTVAVREKDSSTLMLAVVTSSLTPLTGMPLAVTVTAQVPCLPSAFAVMVAVPGLTAFTVPSVTVATWVSELVQVTLGFVAFEGRTAALRSWLSPSTRESVAGVTVTDVTLTSGGVGGGVGSTGFSHPERVVRIAADSSRMALCVFILVMDCCF